MSPALLEARVSERMARLISAGLLRTLGVPRGVDLSSNDYLGFSQNPRLKQAMADAALAEGCGSTGSRLLRGERESLSALERRFARFKGTEAALYFGSGYLANVAVLSAFLDEGDTVFSDSLNHASLIDGMRLGRARRIVFPHCDVDALSEALRSSAPAGQRFLVTESLFSMDGDFAPLRRYATIARNSQAALIVDEAHAVGIYGELGSGRIEAESAASDVFLSINPMGKAFGVAGAFVCGPAWAIEYLVQRARPFIFSTAAPPPIAAALHAALDLIEQARKTRERVLRLAGFLRGLLADMGFAVSREGSQIIPVILGDNFRTVSAAAALRQRGFDVRAIRPPTVPEGAARLRISVNAGLSESILREFAEALAAAVERPAA
jgi:8-amino-7-oxononanoate synthase